MIQCRVRTRYLLHQAGAAPSSETNIVHINLRMNRLKPLSVQSRPQLFAAFCVSRQLINRLWTSQLIYLQIKTFFNGARRLNLFPHQIPLELHLYRQGDMV